MKEKFQFIFVDDQLDADTALENEFIVGLDFPDPWDHLCEVGGKKGIIVRIEKNLCATWNGCWVADIFVMIFAWATKKDFFYYYFISTFISYISVSFLLYIGAHIVHVYIYLYIIYTYIVRTKIKKWINK